MSYDTETLPDDVSTLTEIITAQKTQIHYLEEQNRLLTSALYGRKSEKAIPDNDPQLLLFNEAEASPPAEEEKPAEETTIPKHTRKKRGRKPLPPELPRIEEIHDLKEEEKLCGCGSQLTRIGEETSEKLDIIPAKIQVIRHIRPKYACKQCEGVESDVGTVQIAPPPAQLIPKSIAGEGLLAHLITSKFCDGLPFYRQEKIFQRMGVDLARNTMCGWAIQVADRCRPLLSLMNEEIRSGPLINIDETTVQVLKEPERRNTTKSYMWIFRGGDPDRPIVVFQYHPTRSGDVALNYLRGYNGYVQTDAFSGYDALEYIDGITLLGCFAHARRKFFDVTKATKKGSGKEKVRLTDEALEYIKNLYAIEKKARQEGLCPDEIYQLRQEKAKPLLEEFKEWLDEKYPLTPPKGLLGKAMSYTLNQWKRLERYLEDGILRPDNNLAENALRPFVIGRKNWLFAGHPRGAAASAALYSLIETAKANKLEPYWYLRALFENLHLATMSDDYRALLPQYIDKKLLGKDGVN